jgi:hypothetical protein
MSFKNDVREFEGASFSSALPNCAHRGSDADRPMGKKARWGRSRSGDGDRVKGSENEMFFSGDLDRDLSFASSERRMPGAVLPPESPIRGGAVVMGAVRWMTLVYSSSESVRKEREIVSDS